MDKTETFTKKKTSDHKPQLGLDTKTDRLTDRQLQHDFDSDFESGRVDVLRASCYCGGRKNGNGSLPLFLSHKFPMSGRM
jgi:hypothetical protein